jgi:hypothetical protein
MNEKKPKIPEKEMDKLEQQFDKFDEDVKQMTLDRMNAAPKQETESPTKLSSKELSKEKDIYLKPDRKISDGQKFNEKFREDWNFQKEYVHFRAYHKEILGDTIEMWTHPFGGVGAEFWKIPSGKPIWAPRYVAEQIKKCYYHRLIMEEKVTSSHGMGQFYGSMAVDTTIQRLDAEPVSPKRSMFMGESAFKGAAA